MSQLTARNADRYDLYEQSVQDPDKEVKFLRRVYRKMFRKTPTLLREDFCGTAALACRWVRSSPENRAIGVDLDPVPLRWGRERNLQPLGKAASRVKLIRGNVLTQRREKVQIVTANNFSYFVLKDRRDLLRYFRGVRRSLMEEGFFYLDIYGGPEAQVPQLEEWEYDDYTYVWDQEHFDPVTGDYRCCIHFRFPDGSELRRAFSYSWRLWNLTEVKDLLHEAGFSEVTIYWEGTDVDGDGNGAFRPVTKGDDAEAWVSYIVAKR